MPKCYRIQVLLTFSQLYTTSNFHLRSTSSQYSFFICRYSCSPTNIILSKIADRSFRYASPCFRNRLHLFVNIIMVAVLLFPNRLDSFICHFFLFVSPLWSSITPSLVHSWHKTYIYLFHISFPL